MSQDVEKPKRDITYAPKIIIDPEYKKLITLIESKIKSFPDALGEDCFPLRHIFADGLYIREIIIPKGMFVVGKLHNHSYYNCVLSGEMAVLTSEGVTRVKAPTHIISPPGIKRFGYSYEETVWQTVHANPNNIVDIDVLDSILHVKENIQPCSLDTPCPELDVFIHAILEDVFNVQKFRELTMEIYGHEKIGFWSDWTTEQQDIYMSGDWEAFSKSRGYTDDEIKTLQEWIDMKEAAEDLGFTPLSYIKDLSEATLKRSLENDVNGEIMLSSHIPTNEKLPYRRTLCRQQ